MTDNATIERVEGDPPIVALLRQYATDLTLALPEGYTPGRFKSICINLIRSNPKLANVDPQTFIASVLMSAQMGLEPGPPLGLSWVIPRRIKGRLQASFQIGYQGLRQLAYRSGVVSLIEARIVHDGDEFDFNFGRGGANWTHKPTGEPNRDWTDVYCTAYLVTGAEPFEVMSKPEVLAHRNRYVPDWEKSKAWRENEEEMARKTVTAKLCRQLPMSVEFRTALAVDGSSPRELVPDLAGLVALERAAEEDEDDHSEA